MSDTMIVVEYTAPNAHVVVQGVSAAEVIPELEFALRSAVLGGAGVPQDAPADKAEGPVEPKAKPARKKRAAAKKDAPAVEPEAPSQAPETDAADTSDEDFPLDDKTEEVPSPEAIRAVLLKLGRAKGLALLNKYGAEAISGVPEAKRAALVAEAKKLLEAA